MSGWVRSDRRSRLPRDWSSRRLRVLRRDGGRCMLGFSGCLVVASEVDHIVRGDDHSEGNLQAVCSSCHKVKTGAESVVARRLKASSRFRPVGRHPGLR